jgi:hypothetical protein
MDASSKAQRLFAGLAIVALIAVIVFVLQRSNDRPPESGGPFDPTTTNDAELRRVTESISRLIAAPEGRPHVNALEVLESLAVQSAGARDLKDACVTTYRGLIVSTQKLQEVRAILLSADGGMRPQSELSVVDTARASVLLREANEERERVSSTRDRCHDLYAIAARRFGLALERPRTL